MGDKGEWSMTPAHKVKIAVAAVVSTLSLFGFSAASHAQEKPLRVLFAGAVNNVPMMVAAENGYWSELGLDVSVQVLDSGSQIARALLSGAADIGAGAATSAIPLSRAAGNQLTLVGPYHNNPMVVNGVERAALIASSRAGITKDNPEKLAGKSIGVSVGSTSESYLRGYLKTVNLTMADVRVVNLAVPDMSVALQQGNVDAVVPWEPYVSEIIRTHGARAAVVSRGGPYGASVVGVMVTDAYLHNNKGVLEKYVLGAWKGVKFTRENPQQAALLAQRYISGLNPEDATSAIGFMKAEFDPRISICTEKAVMQEQEALIASGNMKASKPFPYAAIVQADFINGLLAKHPELVDDLAPMPTSLEQCGGRAAT
jgi:ABC-type nitrate/sulfonate/bicarbonate transport system substrate-binding protein